MDDEAPPRCGKHHLTVRERLRSGPCGFRCSAHSSKEAKIVQTCASAFPVHCVSRAHLRVPELSDKDAGAMVRVFALRG